VRADKEVIAAMRGVMDAPADKRDGEIAKVLAHVDKLIGPPKGHPYEGMVKAHQKEAEDAMVKLKTAGEGSTPAPVPSGRP
jgi:hypothetical protein